MFALPSSLSFQEEQTNVWHLICPCVMFLSFKRPCLSHTSHHMQTTEASQSVLFVASPLSILTLVPTKVNSLPSPSFLRINLLLQTAGAHSRLRWWWIEDLLTFMVNNPFKSPKRRRNKWFRVQWFNLQTWSKTKHCWITKNKVLTQHVWIAKCS